MMIGSRWVEAFAHETLTHKMNILSPKKNIIFNVVPYNIRHKKNLINAITDLK
jgi:hypothetical protein